jgi:hypothetical protein
LFNLDANCSVVTLHVKNDAKRAAARDGYGDVDSEDEETDSASNAHKHGKSPDGKAADKAEGDGQKLISWSPSGSSVERLASHEAAGADSPLQLLLPNHGRGTAMSVKWFM